MVKDGYKQTEIGIIPQNWDVGSFKAVGDFYKGGGFSTRNVKSYGIPCVLYGDIYTKYNIYFHHCECFIDLNTAQESTMAMPQDLFFTASGETAQDIGKCVSYLGTHPICIGGDIIAVRPSPNYNSLYLAYTQNSQWLKRQKCSYAQGNSVVHIRIDDIKTLQFLCPNSYIEQEKIAKTLLDVDELVSSLEKLIAKKKAIKQGIMQLLLTPKLEHGCHSIEFKETGISIRKGDPITKKDLNSGRIPVIAGGKTPAYYCNRFNRNGLTITISASGASAGYVQLHSGKIFASDCSTISESTDYDIRYVYYLLKYNQSDIYAAQTGGAQPHIQPRDIDALKVFFVNDKKTQTAIADTLSDLDDAILHLEQKLSKYRQIKQGMMEELLTGRIRLVSQKQKCEPIRSTTNSQGHNRQFDDAVVIAAIVNGFYSDTYPLGRKRIQKLLYLLRRKQDANVSDFKKKAAGPYADEIRYKGGEPIALKNGYISSSKNTGKGTVFSKGKNIEKALEYIDKWEMHTDIDWLISEFRYYKTDKLELLATIDMAICDLERENVEITVASIKTLISQHKEWVDKLSKTYFSDSDIAWAIDECRKLFNKEA